MGDLRRDRSAPPSDNARGPVSPLQMRALKHRVIAAAITSRGAIAAFSTHAIPAAHPA